MRVEGEHVGYRMSVCGVGTCTLGVGMSVYMHLLVARGCIMRERARASVRARKRERGRLFGTIPLCVYRLRS